MDNSIRAEQSRWNIWLKIHISKVFHCIKILFLRYNSNMKPWNLNVVVGALLCFFGRFSLVEFSVTGEYFVHFVRKFIQ